MNTDIRLAMDFWDHPKTVKLGWLLGNDGPIALQRLWCWAAKNRPDGNLFNMDEFDIEIAARWNKRKAGKFFSALVELRWLDKTEEGYVLHEWVEHNPWAADSDSRSDASRLAIMASKYPELYAQYVAAGYKGISKKEYEIATKKYRQHGLAEIPGNPKRMNDEKHCHNQHNQLGGNETAGGDNPTSSNGVPTTLNDTSTTLQRTLNDTSTDVELPLNDVPTNVNEPPISPSPSPLPLPSPKETEIGIGMGIGIGGVGGRAENNEPPTQNPQPVSEAETHTQNPQPDAEPDSGQLGLPLAEEKDTGYNPEPKAETEPVGKDKPAPAPKPETKPKTKAKPKPKEHEPSPIPPGPYNKQAFEVIQEMYWLCNGYTADAGAEIKLIQELAQEYPSVPLFQEFRKARDWLESHPEKGYKDLRRFLRNWISKAYNYYGKDRYYVEEAVFVPIDELTGDIKHVTDTNQNAFGNSAGCGFAP